MTFDPITESEQMNLEINVKYRAQFIQGNHETQFDETEIECIVQRCLNETHESAWWEWDFHNILSYGFPLASTLQK